MIDSLGKGVVHADHDTLTMIIWTFAFLAEGTSYFKGGCQKVVMSAPPKDYVPMFAMGVNQEKYAKNLTVVSNIAEQ